MKRYLFLPLLLWAFTAAASREVYPLDRDWKFFTGNKTEATFINLPHTWNKDALSGTRDYYRGVGNYLKAIDVPAKWKGRRLFLRFDGASSVTNVLVNGRHVGEHRGEGTAFAFEITDLIDFGDRNYLWIMVNNSLRLDVLPTAGDFNKYGGLTGRVTLIATGKAAIDPCDRGGDGIRIRTHEISTERVTGTVDVRVDATQAGSYEIEASFVPDGKNGTVCTRRETIRLAEGRTGETGVPFEIDRPRLWNGPDDPALYRVTVRLRERDRTLDSLVVHTGFRTLALDSDGTLTLNGRRYPVRGAVVHRDRAQVGSAYDRLHAIDDVDLLCEMGANAVRVAGRIHTPEFYESCDRRGLLVFTEIPFAGATDNASKGFINSEDFRRNGLDQLEEMIVQLRNHPCIAAWGLFSEQSVRGEDPTPYVKELNERAKQLDPGRFTYASSNQDGPINFVTNLIVWNHTFGWKEGLPDDIAIWADQLHRHWRQLRSAVSYAAGASILHQDDTLARPDWAGNWHPERWQTYFHERYWDNLHADSLIWGVFVGNLFDYGAAVRTWGEGNGINDCGLVTFDRLYRKDAFYLYKANWNTTEPFVYIVERRWVERHSPVQRIRVYGNVPEAELFVEGVSQGMRTPRNGTFVWDGVKLAEGDNRIEVRGGGSSDATLIRISGRNAVRF